MINYFVYNGNDSRDFGILIRTKNTYDAPQRDLNFISVPGRDGDLIIDNGKYPNVNINYGIMLVAPTLNSLEENPNLNLAAASRTLKQMLYSSFNYYELTDSYDPDYFRLACFSGDLSWETKNTNIAYSEIKFSCKPYRYRKDGKLTHTVTPSAVLSIFNPENMVSLPQITVKGNGNLQISVNNRIFTVNDVTGYVIIDSDMMNVYNPSQTSTNYNTKAQFATFPKLQIGSNVISAASNNITEIDVIPRWRCL